MISKSDGIIVFGTRISIDAKDILDEINTAISLNGAQFVYMHPMDDKELENKYTQFIKYEVGSEEGVLALLASYLIKEPSPQIKEYLDDLDIGYISAESNVGEEELEELMENFEAKKNKVLLIGSDIYNHTRVENIAKLVSIIDKYSDFEVILPKKEISNTLDENLEDVEDIDTYNGSVIYSILDSKQDFIRGSKSFSMAAKIKDGDTVNITFDGENFVKKFDLDPNMKGTVALYPVEDIYDLKGYRFKQVRISKV